ncbi:hypothetical protein [Pontibacillus litoralis]|uniref:Uncharacterized protein n=1 Tax=Pontibacillus litoralis JSM 072002 TaxID=1385512 RepID=A0A0A5G098_9BACI|nr:hypothetical protein [Pontibacillus litoralis]KGX86496.1 hypothetical protein N784_04895 [Pontibacillus litoralis JSM 072002]
MHQPSQKLLQLQLITLGVAFVLCILFLIQPRLTFLLLLSLYALAGSFIYEGLEYYGRKQMPHFIIQITRASLLFVVGTILFFQ